MKHTIGTADDCLIRQNPIVRATIPLLAGASVFLVRWPVSSYPGLYAASTEARRANRREEEGARHNPWGDETALQCAKSEIDRRKDQGVPQAIEAQGGTDGHADDARQRAQVRDKIEQCDHHTPHYRVAQTEQGHGGSDGQSKAGINRCDGEEITRDLRLDVVCDANGRLLI